MTDVNEQSLSAVSADMASPPRPALLHNRTSSGQRFRRFKVIPSQIIPKIIFALRKAPAAAPAGPSAETKAEIEHFTSLTLASDDDAAPAYVRTLLAQGNTAESIFLDVLTPAARLLGAQWETDVTDFAKVTLGVGRLQLIMRQLCDRFAEESANCQVGESVLLTIVPGEQHSFGLSMVSEFFRRAGWNVHSETFTSHQRLTAMVQHRWFDVVGFSVSSHRRLDELQQDIRDIRLSSRNRNVGIIIGGPMVTAHPDALEAMGADMMSADATTAPRQAHDLIELMKVRN